MENTTNNNLNISDEEFKMSFTTDNNAATTDNNKQALKIPNQGFDDLTNKTASDNNKAPKTLIDEKLDKLENFFTSKLQNLSLKQRKLLGYSMIGVGVTLSLLLLFHTFSRLDFSVLVQSSSKQALTGLISKATDATKANKAKASNNLSDSAAQTDEEVINWQPITSLLASSEKRRKAVAKELGINQGEWILAAFSVDCGDCDRAAIKLNQLKLNAKVSNILAITTANQTEATLWKERLGLTFEVRSVSATTFHDSGAVFLPTIIKVKNGVSIGAKENLEDK